MPLNQRQRCPGCAKDVHVALWHYIPSRIRNTGPVCPLCGQKATLSGSVRMPLILLFIASLVVGTTVTQWLGQWIPYPVQSDLMPVLVRMLTGVSGMGLGALIFVALASRMARWHSVRPGE